MQTEKKYIRYKGITRLPSDHDSFDGELEDAVNMSITGGELRPVLPPQVIGTIPGEFKFVHKNMGYEHFIYLNGNDIKAANYSSGAITDVGVIVNIGTSTLKKIDAVGNTLIILTNLDITYALWKDNGYVLLGSQIPFPMINVLNDPINLVLNNVSFSGHSTILNYFRDLSTDSLPSDDQQRLFCNDFYAKINSSIAQLLSEHKLVFPYVARYAVRLYDGSLVMHSQPLIMTPSTFLPFYVIINADNTLTFKFHAAKIKLTWNAQSFSNWSDIIQSVDIFISEQIYNYDASDQGRVTRIQYVAGYPMALGGTEQGIILTGILLKEGDVVSKIADTGALFKIASLTTGDLSVSGNKTIESGNLQNVVNGELMTDDYLTHNKVKAENSFTYNNKIHLTGVSEKYFSGYSYGLQDVVFEVNNKRVQVDFYKFPNGNPMIFYPDARATKAYIHHLDGTDHYNRTINLTPHKFFNGSFFIEPLLMPVNFDVLWGVAESVSTLPAKTDNEESMPNKLYVSSLENPFVFPASSRITLPVGKIMAVSSNTESLADDQYGEAPLLAFTDDGIWALRMGRRPDTGEPTDKYTASRAISRDVVINPNILQMGKALAFVTGKGVVFLSGENPVYISEIIRENNIRNSKLSISSILTALNKPELQTAYNTDVPFETFSAGATLAYDYITGGGRIFVINPSYNYAYVFDLGSATWSKVIASYKRVVNNYPDCYVQIADGTVSNLANIPASSSEKTTCMIVTRPIKFEDYNFVISSLAHRGIFKSALNVVIYASRNGVDYAPVMHRKERLIRMTGTGYKYYKILVIADLDPNEAISGIEVDFSVKYPGRMR